MAVLGLVPLLAACAGGSALSVRPSGSVPLDCVPFARALSGVNLHGAADGWWLQAAGLYDRTATPTIGSVLVFRRSARLPYGHVGVVSELVSDREILLTQANWVRRQVSQDQPVLDVSPANDWSLVRVWWPPADQLGTGAYPVDGFIRPPRPATHAQLAAATPWAEARAVNP